MRSVRSRSLLWLFAIAIFITLTVKGVDARADDFVKEFINISRAAEAARKAGRFTDVEEKRVERLQLVRSATVGKAAESPLLAAYRALELVDGTDDDPGLINKLKYDESARVLVEAWKAMCAAAPQGPVLGEVAARLFEVIHQKQAVWVGTAVADDAAKAPVDDEVLLEILTQAEQLDPCCVAIVPMIEWLKQLDPKESFLRAEVRPSFKLRQQRLLSISHPLLKGIKGSPSIPQAPSSADGRNSSDEGQADAVLPWHAPTEYLKAQSLQLLLDEFETLEDVLQNWFSKYGKDSVPKEIAGRIRFMIPRKAVKGRDANGNRFELLYGRLLLTSVIDKANRRRPAALLMDASGRWEQRMLDLLWREPTDHELAKEPGLREVRDLVMRLEVLEKWSVGGSNFRLCSYPIQDTEFLIRSGAKVLCLKDALGLPRLKFKHANNDPDALVKLLDDRPGEFRTDPLTLLQLQQTQQKRDKTAHPLVEVAKQANLFVVLSRSTPSKSGPAFFKGGKVPILRLQDGGELFFQLTGEGAPICYRETAYGRLVYPLNARGIPGAIVVGCGAGQCMAQVMGEAGYTKDAAIRAIREWIANQTVPDDFVKYVRAKAEARVGEGQPGGESPKGRLGDIAATVALLLDDARKSRLGLSRGPQHMPIQDELDGNFLLFGYRHFRDKRGNLFFSANLRDSIPILDEFGGYTRGVPSNEEEEKRYQHVFAVTESDGKVIPIQQVYSFSDLDRISRSKRTEYLSESLLYAPSFGTYGAILRDELHPFIHPDDKSPLSDDKEKQAVRKKNHNQLEKSEPSFREAELVELHSPIPGWLTQGDSNQAGTLRNIHNAYVKLVKEAAGKIHDAVKGGDAVPEQQRVALRFDKQRRLFEALSNGEDAKALLAIQLASARRYAQKRYYHRAIVYYNDLLERMPAVDLRDPYTPLLETVPTTEDGRKCVRDLRGRIDELSRLICIQMELAGCLRSAGVTESAHAIFSRIVDEFEFFVKPTFGVMEHLLTSYGLQMEQNAEEAIAQLGNVAEIASRAIGQFGLRCEWRSPNVAKPEDTANQMQRTERLVELVMKAGGRERLTKEESKELEVLRRQDEDDRPKEFRYWLERKKAILSAGAESDLYDLACRIGADVDYDVRSGCPLSFAAGQGFQEPADAVIEVVTQSKVEDVVRWCSGPLVVANAAPVDFAHAFLLAWYWADRGDNPKARAALVNIATLCRDAADAAGLGTAEGLVHRANLYRALACANCLSQRLPGVRGARVDFTDALSLQVLMWEREWLAGGLPPHQAAEQADEIEAMVADARALVAATDSSVGTSRYFFPDYTCQFGGVPDYVVRDVIEKPDLFKQIKPEEVGGGNVAQAVKDEKGWVLVSVDEALGYFRRLPGRVPLGEIDRRVVGVD